jgi:hypothetical protein
MKPSRRRRVACSVPEAKDKENQEKGGEFLEKGKNQKNRGKDFCC